MILAVLLGLALAAPVAQAYTVNLEAFPTSPALVGTIVTWSARVAGSLPGSLRYRFRVRRAGEAFRTIRDYGTGSTLQWTASDFEGTFDVEVSVKDIGTGETATALEPFGFTSRVTTGRPAISRTNHPMVYLYSAPPCAVGSRMAVQMVSPDGTVQAIPARDCRDGSSMNFYVAGLAADTQYVVRHVITGGDRTQSGPPVFLTTNPVPVEVTSARAARTVVQAPPPGTKGLLLHSTLFEPASATDLQGNLVWYYPGTLSAVTRVTAGGIFYGFGQRVGAPVFQQLIRSFDVAGTTLWETNAEAINAQLTALGKRRISSFHHEVTPLPNGRIGVLAAVESILTDVQGAGPINVIGDMILVLDSNLQVAWTWDGFDHLDVSQLATLNETCFGAGTCPPIYLSANAHDWTHSNSLAATPDGNLLLSIRHLDWVVKIDYNDGSGSGSILWRLGKNGDFAFNGSDPYPWFSHQHSAEFVSGENSTLAVFDNGNTRSAQDPSAHSRAQVIRLDESSGTAKLVLNVDLGRFSIALGSAHRLSNGNYHFDFGWDSEDRSSVSLEIAGDGKIVYALKTATPSYRSFRMQSLFEPQ